MTNHGRVRRHITLSTLALAALAVPTLAATKNYVGPDNGSFGTAANWSPSGVPVNGDDVILGANVPGGFNASLHATMAGNFPSTGQYNSLTLNSSASGIIFMIVNETSGSLTAGNVNVGTTILDNTFNQSGGSANNFSRLQVGVGASTTNNTYSISGASTTLTSGQIIIGVSGGGVFAQSGGSVVNGGTTAMILGQSAGATGTYNLSGGSLTVSGNNLLVGLKGTGVFNQTGGTVSAYAIQIGNGVAGPGTYNFGGGTIAQGAVGVNYGGTFNFQNGASYPGQIDSGGGTVLVSSDGASVGSLYLTFGGIVMLNGHSFAATDVEDDSGFGGFYTNVIENGGTSAATFSFTPPTAGGGFQGTIIDGGAGPLAINLVGANSYTFYRPSNTYSGQTTVHGVLAGAVDNAFSPNSVIFLAGGQLQVGALAEAIAGLSGSSGSVEMVAGGNLTVGNSSNTSFGGTINGAGTVTKAGSGTLTLTGGGSFAGTIAVQQGALTAGAANGIPVGATVNVGFFGTLNIAANQALAGLSTFLLTPINLSNNPTLSLGAGGADSGIYTNFIGAGTIAQTGAGTLTVGGGPGDNIGNSNAGLAFVVSAGTLVFDKLAGSAVAAGPVLVSGGTLRLNASNLIADTSPVTINGGTFNLSGFSETIGNLTGTGGAIAAGPGSFGVTQSTNGVFAGTLTGTGSFAKLGPADLTLSSVAGYAGAFNVIAGRLILQGPLVATGYSIAPGATLRFSSTTVNVGYGAIQPATGATVEYSNATVNGGNLDGPGAHTLLAGAAFNGTTAQPGVVLNQTGAATLANFSNNGTINSNAALTWTYGVNAFAGTLNVNSTLATTGFASAGIINLAAAGAINNTGTALTLGGGSRTYLGTSNVHGGTLTLSGGTTLEVNGGLLVNNGSISGTVNVNYGATAKGSGAYATVNVNDGGRFSPGNSPGSVTTAAAAWNPGGSYLVEIYDATAPAGTGYDTWNIAGDLNIAAGSTTDSQFTVALASLATPTTPGQALHFNPAIVNTFDIAHVTGAITGFDPARFSINTTAFTNPLPSTTFRISLVGQDLYVSNGPPSLSVATTLSAGQVRLTALTVTGTAILDAGGLHASEIDQLTLPSDGAGGYPGHVDLVDSDLVLHLTPLATVADYIRAWYDAGARDGPGLGASFANPNTAAASLVTLGVIPNADGQGGGLYSTFDGIAVSPTDVLVKFTYLGDTDLNGLVDARDLANLLTGQAGRLTGWKNGDLNYDGSVDGTDVTLLLTSLRNQGAPFSSPGTSGGVPEPAGLIAAPIALVLGRRRR